MPSASSSTIASGECAIMDDVVTLSAIVIVDHRRQMANERRIKKSFYSLFPSGQNNSGILLWPLIESSESDYLALPPPCLKGSH